MQYLEMSRDTEHGGGEGWGFTEAVWAPISKKDGKSWPFWQLIMDVKKNDIIYHLRGKSDPYFIGYSYADSNGYKTNKKPPKPGQWEYAKSFYRIPLKNFAPFIQPINLKEIFRLKKLGLTEYIDQNKQ